MQLSPKGAQFTRLHEGFVATWYADPVGVGTIGIGLTWGSTSFREWWGINKPGMKFGPGAKMTRAEAEAALIYLFDREYGKAVATFLGRKVPQHVFDGMASAVYNLGPGALQWKWAGHAKDGDYKASAAALRNTGTTATNKLGVRITLPGLVRRRKEEGDLIEKGIYAGVLGASAAPADAMADGVLVRGERGPAVAELLRNLTFLGFYDGVLDDVFGYGAEAAVMAFQRAHGLKADGFAGPKTLAAIEQRVSKPAPAARPPTSAAPEPTKQSFWAWLISLFTKGN